MPVDLYNFTPGEILTADAMNNIQSDAASVSQENTFAQPQTFDAAINQSTSAGANNQTPLLNIADIFSDFIASGVQWTVPSSATFTTNMTSGVAILNGQRTVISSASYTFPASSDTYVSINNSGEINYDSVANGATPPSPPSGYVQTAKVVTNSTTISSVVGLLQRTALGDVIGLNVVDYGADPTGVNDSTEAIQRAINDANNSANIGVYGPTGNLSVYFPNGIYLISSQITVPNQVALVAQQGSGARITTSMSSGYAFQFISSVGSIANDQKRLNRAMVGKFTIANTNSSNTASAMLLGGTSSSEGSCAQTMFDSVAIEGFAYSHTFGYNAYVITFLNCNFSGRGNSSSQFCNVLSGASNYGERIVYMGCDIFNYQYVFNNVYGLEVYAIGSSFDYNFPASGNGMLVNNTSTSSWGYYHISQCHIEWDQASSFLVYTAGPDYISIDDCGIYYTNGTDALEGLVYDNGAANIKIGHNQYYAKTIIPYLFGYSSAASGYVEIPYQYTYLNNYFTDTVLNSGSTSSSITWSHVPDVVQVWGYEETSVTSGTAYTVLSQTYDVYGPVNFSISFNIAQNGSAGTLGITINGTTKSPGFGAGNYLSLEDVTYFDSGPITITVTYTPSNTEDIYMNGVVRISQAQ